MFALRVFLLRVRLLALRKLLHGVVALRLLRHRQQMPANKRPVGWKPAQQRAVGRSAAVATSLVMAIACLTAGFVIGRLSVPGSVDPTPQVALPSASIGEPFTKRSERSTAVVPDAKPITVILNPGTAEASNTAEASVATDPGNSTSAGFSRNQPVRTTGRTEESTIQDGISRGEPFKERDYRALRDYTLRRQ